MLLLILFLPFYLKPVNTDSHLISLINTLLSSKKILKMPFLEMSAQWRCFALALKTLHFLESKFKPQFSARDITKLDNYNAYISMLVNGQPTKPFNLHTLAPEKGNPDIVDSLKELSYIKFGRDREEVESEIMGRYKTME